MKNIKPLGNKVLVLPDAPAKESEGGIILPGRVGERPQEGTVIAVGPGRILDNGVRVEVAVFDGDRVLYARYGGTEVKLDGVEHLILDESSILAVEE